MSGSAAPKKPTAAPEEPRQPSPQAQAVRALRNIVIAAVVLVVVFIAYAKYTKNSAELKKERDRVTDLMRHDSARDYKDAEKLLDQGLAIRKTAPYFVGTRAEVSAILWVEDGYADEKDAADKYSQKAESADLHTGARFDAEALDLIGNGQAGEADSRLQALVKRGITTPQIIGAIGETHLHEGMLDAAKSDFKQIHDIATRYGTFYGETFFLSGDFSAAQSILAHVVELDPNHVRARIDRARADIAVGVRFPEAQKTFDDLLPAKGEPNDALSPALKSRVLAGRAELALASGDAASAEQMAKAAVQAGWSLDPQLALAQYDLGMALAKEGKPGALAAFQAAAKQYKSIPRIYLEGAIALAKAGKEQDGEALFTLYKQNGLTDDDKFYLARGDFMMALNKPDEASAAYDMALKKSNNLNATAYYKQGLIVEAKGDKLRGAARTKTLQSALDLYGRAIGLQEQYPEAYRRQGIIFLDARDQKATEKFVTALRYFKAAHASKPVMKEFLTDTYERVKKAGRPFRSFASDWKDEMDKDLK